MTDHVYHLLLSCPLYLPFIEISSRTTLSVVARFLNPIILPFPRQFQPVRLHLVRLNLYLVHCYGLLRERYWTFARGFTFFYSAFILIMNISCLFSVPYPCCQLLFLFPFSNGCITSPTRASMFPFFLCFLQLPLYIHS